MAAFFIVSLMLLGRAAACQNEAMRMGENCGSSSNSFYAPEAVIL
jgi:hypothetical protein